MEKGAVHGKEIIKYGHLSQTLTMYPPHKDSPRTEK